MKKQSEKDSPSFSASVSSSHFQWWPELIHLSEDSEVVAVLVAVVAAGTTDGFESQKEALVSSAFLDAFSAATEQS